MALVTGSSSGVGLALARALAGTPSPTAESGGDTSPPPLRAFNRVVVAVRDVVKGLDAAQAVPCSQFSDWDGEGGVHCDVMRLDVGDPESIVAFAERWGDAPLHLLVHCAGVLPGASAESVAFGDGDKCEASFVVNHLGPWLLTRYLVPALEAGAKTAGVRSRVVSVGSSLESKLSAGEDPLDWALRVGQGGAGYTPWQAYAAGKRANLLTMRELDARMRHDAVAIDAAAATPGFVPGTGLSRHQGTWKHAASRWILPWVIPGARSVERGAEAVRWACASASLDGEARGRFFDGSTERDSSPGSKDPGTAQRLWDASARFWGVRADGSVALDRLRDPPRGFTAGMPVTDVAYGSAPPEAVAHIHSDTNL